MSVQVLAKNVCSTTGDSPHWDEATQSVTYVDVWAGEMHKWDTLKNEDECKKVSRETLSFAIPTRTGELPGEYVFSQGCKVALAGVFPKKIHKPAFRDLDEESKKVQTPVVPRFIAEVEPETKHRFSTGKCDVKGRLWAGTMGNEEDLLDHLDAVARDQRPPKSSEADCSALYCLRQSPSEEDPETMVPVIKSHHSPVCISNGLAWSSDNQTMFFVDSCQRKIFAFDFDAEAGTISNKRAAFTYAPGTFQKWGFPAGMCLDVAGKAWIACYNAGKVVRMDLETGQEVTSVTLSGARRITSCCFGGKNYDELYVTSSRRHVMDFDFLTNQPNAGSLFKITGLGKGMPAYKFDN